MNACCGRQMGVKMKKNLMTVLILALLIVNIVLTSVLMFSVIGTNKKTNELVSNIATVMNLELTVPGEEEKIQVSMKDTEVYNINGAMTIPLVADPELDGSKQSYVRFEVALSMDTKNKGYKTYGEEIDTRASLIKDAITSVVSTHTESECRDDLEGLKVEILEAVQQLFQSDFIYQIALSEIQFG